MTAGERAKRDPHRAFRNRAVRCGILSRLSHSSAGRQKLPLGLSSFASSSAQSLRSNLVFAYVLMTGIHLLIAYIFAQRRVIGGLTQVALEG